jgi:tripartite-type tricarboxylate transporter receptor subunit TctC
MRESAMMRMSRALCAVLALATLGAAQAAFPDRAVQLVVGSSPGGSSDTLARIVAERLQAKWNRAVVIINKPGADNSIAADYVARSDPDGYTLAWVTNAHTVTPFQFKLNYDPIKSFAPITLAAEAPNILVVSPAFPGNSVKDLIERAKAQPGKLNFATPAGKGSSAYLETALLMKLAGIKMTPIPYRGGAEAVMAVQRGEVDLYFSTLSTAMSQVKAGLLKALAVSTKTRSPVMPDLPTVAEAAALPDFEGSDWFGVLAPAGTPSEVVAKLNRDFVEALKSPEVQRRFAEIGARPVGNTPQQFTSLIASDMAKWSNVLKSLDAANP